VREPDLSLPPINDGDIAAPDSVLKESDPRARAEELVNAIMDGGPMSARNAALVRARVGDEMFESLGIVVVPDEPTCDATRAPLAGDERPDVAPDIALIAAAAHEANAAYCRGLGDDSQLPWAEAPEWQRESALKGVQCALDGATPEQLHESWMGAKAADGWRFGEVKDAEAKTHPCMVPYAELPEAQRKKDEVFQRTVRTMASVLADAVDARADAP
jgi:hypothetical protein